MFPLFKIPTHGLGGIVLLVVMFWSTASRAELVPPPGFMRFIPAIGKHAEECKPAPPPLTGPLVLQSRYADDPDGGADDVNPAARIANSKTLQPAVDLENGIRSQVRRLASGSGGNVDCVLEWLVKWSEARSMMIPKGPLGARNWTLSALGALWLQLKFSTAQPLKGKEESTKKIEAWFRDLSGEIMQAYGGRKQGKDFNNHVYWAAWAVMTSAVILDDCDRFDWSMQRFRIAMRQVQPDGVLRNELHRRKRALYYHNFSIQPLSLIAAFAVANGRPLSADEGDALRRLVKLVVEGLNDPNIFEAKADVAQIPPGGVGRFGFLESYCWAQDCPSAWRTQLEGLRPIEEIHLGGNLSEIFADAPRGSTGNRVACGGPKGG